MAGEDDAGEDREMEGHQHREVGAGVDSLHHSEQQGLEDLVSVGRPRPQPGLDQPQDHEDPLVLEVRVLGGQLPHHNRPDGLHHPEGAEKDVGLEDVDGGPEVL